MSQHTPLHTGWRLTAALGSPVPENVAPATVPATVPGCVHTDLLAAGLIDDPYLDDNETHLAWIGRAGWVYETAFDWSPGTDTGTDLVCEGLDTVATITVNDVEAGRTSNMHVAHRFPVRHLLREGENRLAVRFDSAYGYAERTRDFLGDRPNAYPEPFGFIRKNACNFGWDWGPTLVTAGIWRPIGLHEWTARLARVRPLVTVEDGVGKVRVHVIADGGTAGPLTVAARIAGQRVEVPVADGEFTVELGVPEPELWWPRGYGAQPLYELDVELLGADGTVHDTWSRRVGFRTVRLDTAPDEHGRRYTVEINGRPIWVRGVNWIPDDVFVAGITRERLAGRFAQAVDANVNFLRVWGGGIYESEDFYELADELGLLVGQDFLFACAAYPEEEPIAGHVEAEARDNVVRLASHPSLVLWTGNNENIWGHEDWGWKDELGERTWGAGYYFETLPSIVEELDPARPYWPGSPWSGSDDLHPNDPAHGNMHIWDVWNTHDYTHYLTYTPRFAAEFGYQAPPAYATLRRALSDETLAPDSPGMAHHQKAADGDLKLKRGLDAHFGEPADFDDWHWLTQLNQARALSLGISHFRSLRPVCTGTIMWQLNDCWPVTSWAAIDGDGRRKPLWYALRDVYADRLLTLRERDGVPVLFALNDSGAEWHGPVEVTRLSFDGRVLAKHSATLDAEAHGSARVDLPAELTTPDYDRAELLLAEADGRRAWWFFGRDRDLAYPEADFEAVAEPMTGGYAVRVTARSLLRDLTLFPDRVDPAATVDKALVTLLPGESVTFTVSGPEGLDAGAFTAAPVLRCVNDTRR
ncbi:glycoside hydrolase family 2 protein [Phytomonospora endophytica]|uniref:beta-mannosidase n=1 Tax=Phytomonospora endophytica TaxID=714109 RepID=A0A841FVQ1_9ACTN|nr:glycoside hydrolase family 2 protein [Phytomonospora endophytica]MBB6036559.1 beta-mannosidase [Phytomonospora endophytica]GIG65880.1 beta-mannosidase [Phytomonospora endophytica]